MKPALAAVAFAALGGVALASSAAAAPLEASKERCYLIEAGDGGPSAVTAFPGLDLIHGEATAALPALPPGRFVAVACSRNALTPSAGDYRVLRQYALPLTITNGERVAVLEIVERRLRYRVLSGRMAPEERTVVENRLASFQPRFGQTGP